MTQGSRPEGWTLKSVLQASGLAFAGMMITLQLHDWGLWLDDGWSFFLIPAIVGSLFLAKRHPGQGLLTTFVFLPVLLVFMFYAAACLPLGPTK